MPVKNTKNNDKSIEKTVKKEILDDSDDEFIDDDGNNTKKKGVRKAGRTLLVSPNGGSTLNETTFKDLSGLTSSFSTKSGAYFLVFDTIQNSLDGFRKLRTNKPELKVKFSRYQVFFTINGLTESSDYTAVKHELSTLVEKSTGGNVLYFKLYRKDDKYCGCGDMTLDTKDAMDKLIDREGQLKNYTIGSFTGTFYRYNKDGKEGNKEANTNSNNYKTTNNKYTGNKTFNGNKYTKKHTDGEKIYSS